MPPPPFSPLLSLLLLPKPRSNGPQRDLHAHKRSQSRENHSVDNRNGTVPTRFSLDGHSGVPHPPLWAGLRPVPRGPTEGLLFRVLMVELRNALCCRAAGLLRSPEPARLPPGRQQKSREFGQSHDRFIAAICLLDWGSSFRRCSLFVSRFKKSLRWRAKR